MDLDSSPENVNGNGNTKTGDELAEYNLEEYDDDPSAICEPCPYVTLVNL